MTNSTNTDTTTTQSGRRRAVRCAALSIAGLAALGVAVGAAGVANAGTMPTTGPTVAMTIYNNTGQPMDLVGSDNPYGQWISGPRAVLEPGGTEIVTATTSSAGGFGIDVTYALPGDARAVFMANNYGFQADTNGTRMDGRDASYYGIHTNVDSRFPAMNSGYNIFIK